VPAAKWSEAGLTTLDRPEGAIPPAAIVSSLRVVPDRAEYREIPLIEVARPFSPRELVARVRAEGARQPGGSGVG
jgi:hypothetical protein